MNWLSPFIFKPQRDLASWYQSPPGLALLEKENALLNKTLPGLFGYHFISISEIDYDLSSSPISHRVILKQTACHPNSSELLGQPTSLPIQHDSVDALLLGHILEYTHHPHHVLREAERVLHPSGHLILLGFNPLSSLGLYRLALGFTRQMPWQGHFYHPTRLIDWLQLLGFTITTIQYAGFIPPTAYKKITRQLDFMERLQNSWLTPLGNTFIIVAKKLSLIPNKKRAKKYRHRVLDKVVLDKTSLDKPLKPTAQIKYPK